MYVFDRKNLISIFGIPYFPVLPFSFQICLQLFASRLTVQFAKNGTRTGFWGRVRASSALLLQCSTQTLQLLHFVRQLRYLVITFGFLKWEENSFLMTQDENCTKKRPVTRPRKETAVNAFHTAGFPVEEKIHLVRSPVEEKNSLGLDPGLISFTFDHRWSGCNFFLHFWKQEQVNNWGT